MVYKIFKISEKINNKNFIFRQPKKINDYTKFIPILYNNGNNITPFLFQTPTVKLYDNIIDNYIKIPIKTINNKTLLFKLFINNISDIIIENYKLNYKKWNIDITNYDINYTELINEVDFDDESPLQNDYNDGLLNIKLTENITVYNSIKELIPYDDIALSIIKNTDIQAIIELKGLNIIYSNDNKINLDPILIIHQIKFNEDTNFEVKLDNYSILDTEMPNKIDYSKIKNNSSDNESDNNSEEDIQEILNSETSNEESDIHSNLELSDDDDNDDDNDDDDNDYNDIESDNSMNKFLVKIQN